MLTFLIQHFLGRVYSIPSGSMEQTLHGCPGCTGDRVLVDKLIYDFRDPEPGDVIVFEGPEAWTENDIQPRESATSSSAACSGSVRWSASPHPTNATSSSGSSPSAARPSSAATSKSHVLVDGKPLDEPYVYWQNGAPDARQRFDPWWCRRARCG